MLPMLNFRDTVEGAPCVFVFPARAQRVEPQQGAERDFSLGSALVDTADGKSPPRLGELVRLRRASFLFRERVERNCSQVEGNSRTNYGI